MSDLYLIAHKVRGEPAFDVAVIIECSECDGKGCAECDGEGLWWIIPTSGHRAYPYDHINLNNISPVWLNECPPMPEDLPDHYPERFEPAKPQLDIRALLPKAPTMRRRL